jgi:hypothetical protein
MESTTTQLVTTPGFDIQYYINYIVDFFTAHYPQIFSDGQVVVGYAIGLSLVLSFLLLFGIIFSVEALKGIRKREDKIYNMKPEVPKDAEVAPVANNEMAKKWEQVQTHIASNNPSDWRQAIIEADIMLSNLLIQLGYKGQTMSEQFGRVASGDFKTIEAAKEAHGVRNRIAHAGSDFKLNNIEAQRVINLYKQVFEEFFHI